MNLNLKSLPIPSKHFYLKHVAEHVRDFVGDYYRLYPTKAYGTAKSPGSSDAPISHENGTRLIDVVSEGLW